MEQQLAKEISLIKREPRVIIQDNLKKRPQGKFRDLEGSPSHYRLRGLAGNEKKFGESGLGMSMHCATSGHYSSQPDCLAPVVTQKAPGIAQTATLESARFHSSDSFIVVLSLSDLQE